MNYIYWFYIWFYKLFINLGQISASLGALKKASDDLMQLAKREMTEEKREIAYQ